MSPGKIASQAGHAYVGAIVAAMQQTPEVVAAYHADLPAPGTKVCLRGRASAVQRAQEALTAAGIPNYLVVDSGCPDFFNGEPTVTALGFGPCTLDQIPNFVRKLNTL